MFAEMRDDEDKSGWGFAGCVSTWWPLVLYPDSRVIHLHPTAAITLASGAF